MDEPLNIIKVIEDLSEELDQLQLEHSEIGNRIRVVSQKLKKLTNKTIKTTIQTRRPTERTERKLTLEEYRVSVGKQVRIINPKHIRECFGTIIKVGSLYVTVELPNGEHKRRIASNLRLIQHE